MVIGHNQGPTLIEFSKETSDSLGEWLQENPVIQDEDTARAGKILVDRARACVLDMEAERTGKTAPLNEQVRQINDSYREPRTNLENITQELVLRLDAYRKIEEEKRARAAELARQHAQEAEQRAREAEERVEEAREDAATGVVVDVSEASLAATQAAREFAQAIRAADHAERATTLKIGGGFRRALGARSKETLKITDPLKVIAQLGWTERILAAILTEAREYRKEHGQLPEGIWSERQRRL